MLACLTVNHRNASFDLLERLSVGAAQLQQTLIEHDAVDGAVVLATCNRFEVYLDTDRADAAQLVAEAVGVDAAELPAAALLRGDAAVRHLFSVSAGLESVVVGEDEISGQVGRALTEAREAGASSPRLEMLFQRATRTSRGVKTRTQLGGAGRSLVRLALELASSRFSDWSDTRVLLVGTGQYAATTVAALRDRGAEQIAVFSPSGRAEPFALKYALTATRDLADAAANADVIITCTSGNDSVLSASTLAPAHRRLLIDLGLPRNIDPDVATVPHIELLDLETIKLHAPLEELSATSDAHELVETAAAEFTAEALAAPSVVALRRHVLGLLDRELHRSGVTPEVEAALRHFAGVLMHGPSVRAREHAAAGMSDDFAGALDAVFGIGHQIVTRSDSASHSSSASVTSNAS